MPEERRVIWSIESSKQIQPVKKYPLDEWSENEVNSFLEKLKTFEGLAARFPKLYPPSVTYPELRRAVVTKHQSVIYEIDGEAIRLHTTLDHRQQN